MPFKVLPESSASEKKFSFNAAHPMFRYEVSAVDSQIIERMKQAGVIVVVGMGGSVLPLKAFIDFFQLQSKIFLLDTVDPDRFAVIKTLPNPLFCIVSKSGETLEIKALLEQIIAAGFSKNILTVTDAQKGFLREFTAKENLLSLPIPQDIGGRFTNFTIFHRALLESQGIAFEHMLKHAKKVVENFKKDASLLEKLYQQLFTSDRRNLILWAYGDRTFGLAAWMQQVIGESLGKKTKAGVRKGILPVVLKGPQDQHSVLQLLSDGPQDKVLWFFSAFHGEGVLNEALQILLESTFKTFEERLANPETFQPIARFDLSTNTEFFVEMIVTIQAFTEYSADRLEINAFDQPGVERGKEIARELLKDVWNH
ncbi:MAG: hypothetical protein J0L93_10665 [Deltaproteobacteria bacterium]|nr:hypothetical protein [Deltaproteobacteria bacterium]